MTGWSPVTHSNSRRRCRRSGLRQAGPHSDETSGSHGYRPTDRIIAEIGEFAFALANLGNSAP
jgi:hypothetical protein